MNTINQLTRNDFNKLNFENKLSTVYNSGEFVDSHITSVGESKLLNLYSINKFHVEVIYDVVGTQVKGINTYKFGNEMNCFHPNMEMVS